MLLTFDIFFRNKIKTKLSKKFTSKEYFYEFIKFFVDYSSKEEFSSSKQFNYEIIFLWYHHNILNVNILEN